MRSATPGRHGDLRDLVLVWEPEAETDPEEVERLGRQLRAELNGLDVESVTAVSQDAVPPGAKGDALTWAALLITFSASGGVFTSLIETLRDWLGRHAGAHRLSVTIDGDAVELDHASAAERSALPDAYIYRHMPG